MRPVLDSHNLHKYNHTQRFVALWYHTSCTWALTCFSSSLYFHCGDLRLLPSIGISLSLVHCLYLYTSLPTGISPPSPPCGHYIQLSLLRRISLASSSLDLDMCTCPYFSTEIYLSPPSLHHCICPVFLIEICLHSLSLDYYLYICP